MNKEFIYNAWAPDFSPWSTWVKPVLFATMQETAIIPGEPAPQFDLSWVPSSAANHTMVIDLPCAEAVHLGLALARLGYRPVPLYNAVPSPGAEVLKNYPPAGTLVNVEPIVAALWRGTEELMNLRAHLNPNAPPVFLLDANRRTGITAPQPRFFDNRSVSFVTDFPSANFLHAHHITGVILVQRLGTHPQPDLARTLLRWQEGGLQIMSVMLSEPSGSPVPIIVERPSKFRSLWQRMLVAAGLRRNELGGFGGMIPEPSSG